jgi:hypothetical protein
MMTDTDARGGPDAARAAARRLRAIGEGSPIAEEPPELFRLADLAASRIVAASHGKYSAGQQKNLADGLLEALTVLRYGPLLGSDPAAAEPAKAKVLAIVGILDMALELGSE